MAHIDRLRELAAERGWSLDPQGLVPPDGSAPIAATEEAIYEALALPWIPPEIRDGGDELAAGHEGRLPTLVSRADIRGIGASILDHVRFRHPTGEAAKRYNVLQKIAYVTVVFVLLPLIILMGLGMSPRLDTLFGGWVAWFGGRQSVRSIHFLIAWALVAFVLIHVFEVIVTGLWNNLRSMITGRYRVPQEAPHE
jgi:hypothetical protein